MSQKIIAKFVIEAFSDGRVQVSGPIHNFLLFRQVMNGAERVVLETVIKRAQSEAGREVSRIITPETIVPVKLKAVN